ncbi:MAG: DUF177 domain-containing protein [Patescibacteria group bacterium]|jgi:uncharacterized protein
MVKQSLEHYHINQFTRLPKGESAADQIEINQLIGSKLVGLDLIGPIGVNLEWTNNYPVLDLSLATTTSYQTVCIKCQKEIEQKIDSSDQYEYSRNNDDLNYQIHSDDTINLTQAIIDTTALDLTEYPVCKTDCRGLCPECGIDLNSNPNHTHKTS